jgi:hypothetical protein
MLMAFNLKRGCKYDQSQHSSWSRVTNKWTESRTLNGLEVCDWRQRQTNCTESEADGWIRLSRFLVVTYYLFVRLNKRFSDCKYLQYKYSTFPGSE